MEDLIKAKTQLDKKELLAADLIHRLDHRSNSISDCEDDTFAKLVIFAEKGMEKILEYITIKGYWDKYTGISGINELQSMMDDESHIKRIHNYDIRFNDIKKGGNGITVGKKLISCVTKIKDLELNVAILELPPAGSSSTDSDLFNMKIEGMEGVEILKISQEVHIMTQDQIFDKEGTLNCDTLTIMAKAINEQVNFP